jgi:SAM-dependent methyltransferase
MALLQGKTSVAVYCCVRCAGRPPLHRSGQTLTCPNCGTAFPLVRDIPVLINDSNSVFAVSDFIGGAGYAGDHYGTSSDQSSGLHKAYRRIARGLLNHAVKKRYFDTEHAVALIQTENPNARILAIGAGHTTYPGPGEFHYTDVAFSKNTTAIVDAHDLPFPDQYFDLAVAVAVMEHVADPVRCASEIWRTLKPGGRVFSATPFLQPVHMGAYDFTRFTYLGHRRLFRWFDDIESGLALGPGATLAWSIQYALVSFSDHPLYRRLARLAGLLLTVPIKYLDLPARKHKGAYDSAGGFFFFGRKREAPISDRDLIGLFRGGAGS